MSRSKRILRWAAIAAAVLALLVVALVVAVHTPPGRRFVSSQVTALLAGQNIGFRAEDLDYNLLDLSVALNQLVVRADDRPDAPPFLEVGRLDLDVGLLALLRGRLVIESGTIEGLSVHYLVEADGSDNVPRPPSDPDAPAGEPLDYLIDQLSASGATVRFEDRAQQIDAVLPIQSLTVDGNPATGRHAIVLAASDGTVRAQGRDARLDEIRAELDLGDDDVRFETVTLAAEGSTAALSGTVTGFEAPRVDARLETDVDVERAARLRGVTDPAGGRLVLDARAEGPLETLRVTARLEGRALQFRGVSRVAVDAQAGYDAGTGVATADALRVDAPWGTLSGNGAVATESGPSRVTLRADGLDIGQLMRALELSETAATRLDGTVAMTWPALDYVAASGTADLSLTPTAPRPAASSMPVAGRIAVEATNGDAVARITNLNAAGARIDGQLALENQDVVSGRLKAGVADLGTTIARLETFLGRAPGSLSPTPVSGALTADVTLGGTVSAPTARASVAAPALDVGEAGAIALAADGRYAPEAATLERLDVTWGEARVEASGRVGLTGRQPLSGRFAVDGLRLAPVLALAGQQDATADGTVSMTGSAAGTLERPQATASIRATDLVVLQEPLGQLAANAALAGQQVTLDELVLDKPQPGPSGRLTASGRYALDSGAYQFTLDSSDLQLTALTLPDGRPVRGTVDLSARGEGTASDPAADARVVLDDLRLAEHELGRVAADARLAGTTAVVELAADRFGTTVDARVGTDAPYAATVQARIAGLDLATLPVTLTTPLTGTVAATLEADGPLAEPATGRARATIETLAGEWNDQPFALDGPAVLAFASERLTIDRLALTARDSTVSLSGALPLTDRDGPGALAIEARANLATLADYAPAESELTATGRLELAGTVRGTFAALDPDLELRIDDAAVSTPEIAPGLSNVTTRARVANGAAAVEQLVANFGAALFELTAELPFALLPDLPVEIPRQTGDARVTARVENFDPGTSPGAPDGLSGRISLDAQASAPRLELAALTGALTFPDLSVAYQGLDLVQRGSSTIEVADGVARIAQFDLGGSAGTVRATGEVGLLETRPLDVAVLGALNMAAVGSLVDGMRADGEATIDVAATGTAATPDLRGSIAMTDVTVTVDEPALAVERLEARVDLGGERVTLSTLEGTLNGGPFSGSGGFAVGGEGLRDVNLRLTADDVAMSAPLDLRSLSAANFEVTERDGNLLVNGKVTIREAALTGDVKFDRGVLASLTAPRALDLTEERNATLERMALDVQVVTETPIILDNNLARAEITTDVRVVGSPYETGLSGRMAILEGGELVLNERRYAVERGTITFLDERRITPSFDLTLTTSASRYDITLSVTGEPDDTETALTSDPVLPEPDIMALLLTGRTLDEMRGEEGDIAKEQMLAYLGGRAGSRLGRGLERATGLSEVRIEPSLIANEADPSARLTIGQDLTDRLRLIYSADLADADDRILVARYDVTRRFQTNAINQGDGSYRFDFQHDLRLGGRPAPGRLPRSRPTIASLEVETDLLTESELRELLDLEVGQPFDYFSARDGVDRIERELRARDHLQGKVRLGRTVTDDTVALVLTVAAGPVVTLAYTGITPPSKVNAEVRRQWTRGVFDTQRAADAAGALRAWLIKERYLDATIDHDITDAGPGTRRVTFAVTPGTRFTRIETVFVGASGVSPDTLDDIIDGQDLELELFTDPVIVTELLERYYREEGYLVAEVDAPRYEYEGATARVVIEVREGPAFTVADVAVSGATVLEPRSLVAELPVVTGEPYRPAAAERAHDRIRQLYWDRGYNDVRSDHTLELNRDRGTVLVTFALQEGARSVVADVVIAGNERTSTRLVREQVALEAGQPLDLGVLGRSRRRLYDTGAYSIVDITRTVDGDPAAPSAGDDKPIRLDVAVREMQPFQVRYGVSFDTERGFGGTANLTNRNSLGKARTFGLSTRFAQRLREARLYAAQPSLRYAPTQTSGNLYYRDERNDENALVDAFNIERYGVSVQRERTLRNAYVWSYGYRYERARKFGAGLDRALEETIAVAPLTSTLTREARDEVLDASTGSFTGHAFSVSPGWLGADAPFLKYFGQYFKYLPLAPPTRKPFTNEVLRPRLVYAVGARLGLARGLGGAVPETERFYAGGSTTLRGFAPNAVGPIGDDRIPTGGDAMIVLNNELRFPIVSIFDGVGFLDIGNVFDRVSDFSFSDLRETVGVGVRIRTPWVLIRGDYGFVLDPRRGEGRNRLYFSIGQAF